jgi:hypothetical protein
MLAEDVKVLFSGFEPTHDMRAKLDLLLNQLHLKSPSQSFLSVTVTLTNGLFEGVIKVTSTAENFVAKATDVQVGELGHKLCDKLISQLDKWKSLRFER